MIKVRVSQIFSPQVDDVVKAKKAIDDGTPFTEAVANFSTCPSKEAEGDLGWMPEENAQGLIGQAISESDVGKILGPIHSPYGYHILKVTEIELDMPDGPFTRETLMTEVNQELPEVHTLLFKKFQIGMPVAGYKPGETVNSVAEAHSKNVTEILALLNNEMGDQVVSLISPEDLKGKMNAGDSNLKILDIRERWEYDIAKFNGAEFITQETVESILGNLKPENEIVLVDWKGDRGPSFQKYLAERELLNVKTLEGGIDAWADRIDPSVARYEIDEEDDDYRYDDVFDDQPQ